MECTTELEIALRLISAGIAEIEDAKNSNFESGIQYEALKDVLEDVVDNRNESLEGWNGRPDERHFTVAEAAGLLHRTKLWLQVHREDVTQLLESFECWAAE